jgi:hypothetical protein
MELLQDKLKQIGIGKGAEGVMEGEEGGGMEEEG